MPRLHLLVLGVVLSCSPRPPIGSTVAKAGSGTWTASGSFFALSVSDATVTATWYREKLGFEVLREGGSPDGGLRFALLRRGDHLIEVIQRKAATAPTAMPDRSFEQGIFKAGFWITDLDGLASELERTRTRFSHGIVVPPGADYRTFAVLDPDANVVQFFGR